MQKPILTSQRILQVCLFLLAFIATFGGGLQLYLGEPQTTPRLDNVHRFMAGIYFSLGPLAAWIAWTIRSHSTLIYFIAFCAAMAGVGRVISLSIVGSPGTMYLVSMAVEFVVPIIMVAAQRKASHAQQP